ncbi:MAG: hypothetical protein AAB401_14250, partial [Acidobacteriota bacterium]
MGSGIVDFWSKPFGKALCILAAAIVVILALWKVPQWQVRAYHGQLDATAISKLDPKDLIQLQKDLITVENNARLTLAQIIGGLVVLLGLYATFKNVQIAQKNAEIAEEGKLTDRFSKAVELLSYDKDSKLETRLGGIYALERIAKDSRKDHWTVMEVLTAYVRMHAPKYPQSSKQVGADVQAILDVLSRRSWTAFEEADQILDLHLLNLRSVNLRDHSFKRANFSESILYR